MHGRCRITAAASWNPLAVSASESSARLRAHTPDMTTRAPESRIAHRTLQKVASGAVARNGRSPASQGQNRSQRLRFRKQED